MEREYTIQDRMFDISGVVVPDKTKIQCKDCTYAERLKYFDKCDSAVCEMYTQKPIHILFPNENGEYEICDHYKSNITMKKCKIK